MQLTRIRLDNFKKFKLLDHEFKPGINVIRGNLNETGKSTLLEGIKVALFDNPRSSKKEMDSYLTWGSNNKSKTLIEFKVEERQYQLEKDFDAKTIRLTEVPGSNEWNTPKEVESRISQLLGTSSPDLFLSTACIRQDEVRSISSGEREISDNLEGIVTGGTEQAVASKVIDSLSKQVSRMTRGMERLVRSPGDIARLSQEVDKQATDLEQIKVEVFEVESQKITFVESQQKLNNIEDKLSQTEALLEKNKRRQEIEKILKDLESDFDTIDKLISEIKSLEEEVAKAREGLSEMDGFTESNQVVEISKGLLQLEVERKKINEDLAGVKREMKTATIQLKKSPIQEWLASKASLILGIAFSVLGLTGILIHPGIMAIGITGLIYVIAALIARNSVNRLQGQVSNLHDRSTQMENALTAIDEREISCLSQAKCDNVGEFRKKESKSNELLTRKTEVENQLLGKLGSQTVEQLVQQRQTLARALAEERTKLTDDLKNTKISPEEYVRLEREAKDLRSEKETLQGSKLECEVGIRKAKYSIEDQVRQEEILDLSKNNLKRLNRRLKVYQLAQGFISSARENTLTSVTNRLQKEIQGYFEKFTRGKYNRVSVGDKPLDFWVFSEEKDDWARPEEFSGGVIDEFYLASRLALVRLIFGEIKPPLLLDDPFTNFDEPRLAETLKSLKELSGEHQIIIFTLRNDYDSVADHLIELTTE